MPFTSPPPSSKRHALLPLSCKPWVLMQKNRSNYIIVLHPIPSSGVCAL